MNISIDRLFFPTKHAAVINKESNQGRKDLRFLWLHKTARYAPFSVITQNVPLCIDIAFH